MWILTTLYLAYLIKRVVGFVKMFSKKMLKSEMTKRLFDLCCDICIFLLLFINSLKYTGIGNTAGGLENIIIIIMVVCFVIKVNTK